MTIRVFQINIKPETEGERGLPKISVNEAMVRYAGLEGDFNRYRSEKCGSDPEKAILLQTLGIYGELNAEGWPANQEILEKT